MSGINEQLFSAVENGELENVKDLINQYGLDHSEAYDSLCKSIILNHKEITKLLLSNGCRVNSKNVPSNTPLHFAVQNGDIEIVEMLLNNKADIYAINENHLNAVLTAVSIDNEEIVDLFLSRNLYLKNDHNSGNPLLVAVEHGLYKMTKKLIQLGTPVNITCQLENQFTPLHLAVRMCNRDCSIVELLLKHGADVNSKTTEGLTSIHVASAKGYVKIIRLLLSNNADVNDLTNNMLTPLYFAVQNSHREAAKYLMYHGANIDAEFENGRTVLNLAVCKELSIIVEDILKYCPNTSNTSNKNSLKIAAKNSCGSRFKSIVKNLLQYGFSIEPDDVNDTDLLHNAIKEGYLPIIQDLIKHGLDLACNMEENCTILHIAAKYKQVEIAKLFLTHGVDVNAKDKVGKTAIQYSIENSDSKTTKLLLLHGANIKKNLDLLRVATVKGWNEIVEILLESEIDIEATNEDGMTALHLICCNKFYVHNKNRVDIVRLLLSSGANVNAKTNKTQSTSLHLACKEKNLYVVEKLLEHKADVNVRELNGRTPLHISYQRTDEEVVKVLLDAGSDINILDKNNLSAYETVDSLIDSRDYAEVSLILSSHLIMLKTANFFVSQKDLIFMHLNLEDSTRLHAKNCEKEIQKLKLEKIANNNKLSFYNILTKNIHSLANYARNESIIRIYESNNYKIKFPIYGLIIERNLTQSIQRRPLLERAQEILKYYSELPYECYDHILGYLSDADLENIINTHSTV